jgi:hypothetical protein
MSKLRFRISMSLDGFMAGPSQSVNNPLGIGGMRLRCRAPRRLPGSLETLLSAVSLHNEALHMPRRLTHE